MQLKLDISKACLLQGQPQTVLKQNWKRFVTLGSLRASCSIFTRPRGAPPRAGRQPWLQGARTREALPELPWLTPSARRHRQQHKPLRPTSLSIPCCYQAHCSYSTWNSQMGHASQLCDPRRFVNVDGTPGMCILGWVPTSPVYPSVYHSCRKLSKRYHSTRCPTEIKESPRPRRMQGRTEIYKARRCTGTWLRSETDSQPRVSSSPHLCTSRGKPGRWPGQMHTSNRVSMLRVFTLLQRREVCQKIPARNKIQRMLISSVYSERTALNWSIFTTSRTVSKERVSNQPSTHPALQLSSFQVCMYLYVCMLINLLKKQKNL